MTQVDPPSSKGNSDTQGDLLGQVTHSDKPILQMLNLVLQTAFLKSCPKPISLLLIGKPGIGKTRLLSPLAKLKEVSYINDITPKYLVEFLEKAKRGEKKFLAIPDFTNPTSHGKNTRTNLIGIMRSMTEEGIVDLSAYHLEFKADFPVRAGLITATTLDSYQSFKKSWKGTGFLSRLLPFSFSHSPQTKQQIMDNIDARKPDVIDKVTFKINKDPPVIRASEVLLRQLRVYEELLSKSTGSLPYRQQIQLNALTEAHAVLRCDIEVKQEDIDSIAWLLNWINYDFKVL